MHKKQGVRSLAFFVWIDVLQSERGSRKEGPVLDVQIFGRKITELFIFKKSSKLLNLKFPQRNANKITLMISGK